MKLLTIISVDTDITSVHIFYLHQILDKNVKISKKTWDSVSKVIYYNIRIGCQTEFLTRWKKHRLRVNENRVLIKLSGLKGGR